MTAWQKGQRAFRPANSSGAATERPHSGQSQMIDIAHASQYCLSRELLCFSDSELEHGLAQHNLVARLKDLSADGDAIDVSPIRCISVLDLEASAAVVNQGVPRLDS